MFNQYPSPEFAPPQFWSGVATFGISTLGGLFGGSGDLTATEKGPMALRGAHCGTYPHSLEEVGAAYMRAPQNVRARLREVISDISWMGPLLQTDADVVKAGMFFAEGGTDCKHNRWDTAIKLVLDKLMADYGGATREGFATVGAQSGAVEGDPVVYTPDPGADPADGFRATVGAQITEAFEGVTDTLQQVILGATGGAARVASGAEAGAQIQQERVAGGSFLGMDPTTVLIGGLALVAVLFAVRS